MIQICKSCGAVNSEAVARCCFCDEPFAGAPEVASARAGAAAASADEESSSLHSTSSGGNFAEQTATWRHELATRVEAYRARRGQFVPDEPQTGLSLPQSEFDGDEEPQEPHEVPRQAPLFSPQAEEHQLHRTLPLRSARARAVERVEISVTQPELDFDASETRPGATVAKTGNANSVAPLADRQHAGFIDAIFLLLSYTGFLGMFHAFGGRLTLEKSDVLVMAVALALFYAQYFALFTVFGGETPGMLLCKLRVVSFDGGVPTSRQLLWRSFGYLVSGGTALLGFLWALWDEDRLTWQDRISQTYLTNALAPRSAVETEDHSDDAGIAEGRPGIQWRRTTH